MAMVRHYTKERYGNASFSFEPWSDKIISPELILCAPDKDIRTYGPFSANVIISDDEEQN